jgi:hypothetical protein
MTKQEKYLFDVRNLLNRNVVDKPCYRLKFEGKYIATPKGKSVWNNIGSAKNAVNLHYGDYIWYTYCNAHNIIGDIKSKDLIAELFKDGIIQIVEI